MYAMLVGLCIIMSYLRSTKRQEYIQITKKEKKNGVEVSQKRLRKIILKYLNDIENLVQF